jgi:membrane protein DedA with SNARE-associated domain
MDGIVHWVMTFIGLHPGWVFFVMFLVSFGESLAFVGLIFPGTAILLAAGALIPGAWMLLWPILLGAISGAVIGDGVSYGIGWRFGRDVERMWPLNRRPDLIARGTAFFERHGGKSIFIGRFFGPVLAIVPLTAGILRMPPGRFWLANIASAIIWAPLILFPGAAITETMGRLTVGEEHAVPVVVIAILVLGAAAWVIWRRRR